MNKTEKNKWQETRKNGAFSYVFKTSFISLILVVGIYFFGNAYIYKDEIDNYINYNLDTNLMSNLMVVGISYIGIIIISFIFWKVNEARYRKSLEEGKE